RAQRVRAGRDLEHRLVRSVGRRARQGARHAHRRRNRGRRSAHARQLDERADPPLPCGAGVTMAEPVSLDQLCVDTMRFLAVDAVQKAGSGHPGMPLGASPMAYVLWTRLLKHNPRNPGWFDRDRFVLSAGNGSMLLYSLLYLTGYDVSLDDIKQFRQLGSKTPGHPERGHTPGVETTTGPLGQGFANAVGMAIAEAQLAARYNRPGFAVIDHATYAIVS